MTHEQRDATPQARAGFLQEAGYPMSDAMCKSFTAQGITLADVSAEQNNLLLNHEGKRRLDDVLTGWVTGTLDAKRTLERLFPLAVHYRYGMADEATQMELLSSTERASYPAARLIIETCLAMADHIGGPAGDRFLDDLDSVSHELIFGVSREEFRDRLKRSRDGGSLPPRG